MLLMQAYKCLTHRCIAKTSHCAQLRVASPYRSLPRNSYGLLVWNYSNRIQYGFHTIARHESKCQETARDNRVPSASCESIEATSSSTSDWNENTLSLSDSSNLVNNVTPLGTEENALQEISKLAHRGSAIRYHLGKLISHGGVKPQLPHFEAWILENCNPERGSASNVSRLLEEAVEEKIPLGKTIFAAALKALVVHPDPVLLAKVLDLCATNWIVLDEEMQHFVVASYIRSDQTELAQEQMQQISRDKKTSQPWLYILFLQALVRRGDWESVIRTCYKLQDDHMRQFDMPHDFWKWLLEEATIAKETWIIRWIWDLWVERMWIEPEKDTLHGVLSIAIENGLPILAESAVTILKHKGRKEGGWMEVSKTAYSVEETYEAAELQKPPEGVRNLKRGGIMWNLFPDAGRSLGSPRLDPWTAIDSQLEAGVPYAKILRNQKEVLGLLRKEKHI